MARKVLAYSSHTGMLHAVNKGPAQRCHLLRIAAKCAMANHRITLVVQIQHRRKTEVDTSCQYFGGHQPASLAGAGQRVGTGSNCMHGWQAGKATTQTLDAPSFLVNGN